MSARRASIAACVALGCSTEMTLIEPEPGLERMMEQPRYNAYAPSPLFGDGRAMRPPPAGTVPRERLVGSTVFTRGTEDGREVDRIPIPLTRALLETGRERFETVCATCHGVLGDGVSPVAENMQLRPPRSLHDAEVRDATPGRIFRVASEGYGLMPSYAAWLTVEERWAVVAYVRALELSRAARVDALPADVRDELAREAP